MLLIPRIFAIGIIHYLQHKDKDNAFEYFENFTANHENCVDDEVAVQLLLQAVHMKCPDTDLRECK